MSAIIVVVGPAGSGKSSIVAAYGKWLEENGYRVARVNLDPAAEYVPYQPTIDVRRWVTARDVAVKYGLGPNGALIKAIEIVTQKLGEILEPLKGMDVDFVLIDTPGQMEVFVFRELSIELFRYLKSFSDRVACIFVVDASIVREATDYAFLSLLSIAYQLRFGVDTVIVLNKIDLAPDLDIVGDVVSDVDRVLKNLEMQGAYGEMLAEILRVIQSYGKGMAVPRVSATQMTGFEDLHRIVHELTCSCGDLT